MATNEMDTVLYQFEGVLFNVEETNDIHKRIQEDTKFAERYFKNFIRTRPTSSGGGEKSGSAQNNTVAAPCSSSNRGQQDQWAEEEEWRQGEGTAHGETVERGSVYAGTQEEETFQWNSDSVKLLLELYRVRKDAFRDPKQKKVTLWRGIINEFEQKGYRGLTVDMLDNKFRNMKKTFVAIKDNNSKKKTGRGAIQWQYFDTFCEIFSNDCAVNLNRTLILESGVGQQASKRKAQTEIDEDVDEPCATKVSQGGKKAARAKRLEAQRTHQLQVEEQRLVAISNLVKEVEESNRIQKERNDLLRSFLDKLNN